MFFFKKVDINEFKNFLSFIKLIGSDGKRGKKFRVLIEIHHELNHEDNLVIKVCDFLESSMVLTLILFLQLNHEFNFSTFWVTSIEVVLWGFAIYWLLNVSALKAIKFSLEKLQEIITTTP